MGGPPPPPGMMGGANAGLPKLAARVPTKATRNYYCDLIPKNKVKATSWIKDGIVEKMNGIKLDTSELEELFSNEAKSAAPSETVKKPVKQLVTFVDPAKANNVALLLGYMRISNEDLAKGILEMDETRLSQNNIEALKDKTPTADEMEAIGAYDGDLSLLAPTDKFYREVGQIPRLTNRLNCWAFKFKFANETAQIQPDLETVTLACSEILNSKRFKEFLSVVLAIANFLNGKQARMKDNYGFQLSSLLKLRDTKSSDNKTTLLQYIGVFCEQKYPHLVDLAADFEHLEQATRISVPDLVSEIKKLQLGVGAVEHEYNAYKKLIENTFAEDGEAVVKEKIESDRFIITMGQFLEVALKQVSEIEGSLIAMNDQLTQLAESYAEDAKTMTTNPSEFLTKMNTFFISFRQSIEEYKKAKDAEERKKKRLEQEALQKLKRQQTREKEGGSPVSAEGGGDGESSMNRALAKRRAIRRNEDEEQESAPQIGVSGDDDDDEDKLSAKNLLDGSQFRTRRASRFVK
jgi:hypothetical protein